MDDTQRQQPAPATQEPTRVDEETEKLLQELRLAPSEWQQKLLDKWWLPLTMLVPVVVLFALGLSQDVYLYLDNPNPFRLKHAVYGLDVIYISFAVMLMTAFWFCIRFSRLVPSALHGLWDNGLLVSKTKTETSDGTPPAARFLLRYETALGSRWRYAVLGVVVIFFVTILIPAVDFTDFSFQSFLSTTDWLFFVLKWLIFPLLWVGMISAVVWPILVTARYMRQLTEGFDLGVVPSHPDQCGGLKPIGDIFLQLAMMALVASLILSFFGVGRDVLDALGVLPERQPETLTEDLLNLLREPKLITRIISNIGALVAIVAGTVLFLYPISGIREEMKKKKTDLTLELADVAAEFDQELEKAIKARDEKQIKQAQSKLETLQNTYLYLQSYPEWPIKGALFKFRVPQIFSILGLLINLFISAKELF